MHKTSTNKQSAQQKQVQLQQVSSFDGYQQELSDDRETTAQIIQINSQKKNDLFGFWCTVIFFSVIFCLICGSVLYQQNMTTNPKSDEEDDVYIADEPYKQGEEVSEIYDLVKLNTTTALCLDGSPGSYYESRTGDPSRILIFFQGGGWCYGLNDSSTLQNCYQRSKDTFGSSERRQSTPRTIQNSILSRHPDNEFRNWKKIFLNYCDGSGHQGTRKDPVEINGQKIYFRGHNITTENFQDLEKKYGLFSRAKKVVLSGLSAGGLAVFTWANYMAERVKNGRVYAIPDAGIFYDGNDITAKKPIYRTLMTNMMKLANAQIDPPTPQCIKQHPTQKVNCMFAQHLYKHIKVPIFAVQSVYDSWSLPYIYGIRCRLLNQCSEQSKEAMQQNRESILGILKQIGGKSGNGVFGIGCYLHGLVQTNQYLNSQFTIPSNSTWTTGKAISQWFRNRKGNNSRVDFKPYPSNEGCS